MCNPKHHFPTFHSTVKLMRTFDEDTSRFIFLLLGTDSCFCNIPPFISDPGNLTGVT